MPKPLYTLCAQFSIENKENGLVSLIDVIEKIQFTKIQAPTTPLPPGHILAIPWQPFRILAVWMLEPDDDETQEFETQIALVLPPNNEELPLVTGTATFTRSKPLFRATVLLQAPPPINSPGLMRVVSRIRRKNVETWITQEYPIIVEASEVQAADPASN